MPLIWDDNKYMLIDEDDQYDKNRFVIARKLFVTLNKKDDEESQVRFFSNFYSNQFGRIIFYVLFYISFLAKSTINGAIR